MLMKMAKAVLMKCFIRLTDRGPIGFLSDKVAVKEILFRKVLAWL
jgi:hypothetical protein